MTTPTNNSIRALSTDSFDTEPLHNSTPSSDTISTTSPTSDEASTRTLSERLVQCRQNQDELTSKIEKKTGELFKAAGRCLVKGATIIGAGIVKGTKAIGDTAEKITDPLLEGREFLQEKGIQVLSTRIKSLSEIKAGRLTKGPEAVKSLVNKMIDGNVKVIQAAENTSTLIGEATYTGIRTIFKAVRIFVNILSLGLLAKTKILDKGECISEAIALGVAFVARAAFSVLFQVLGNAAVFVTAGTITGVITSGLAGLGALLLGLAIYQPTAIPLAIKAQRQDKKIAELEASNRALETKLDTALVLLAKIAEKGGVSQAELDGVLSSTRTNDGPESEQFFDSEDELDTRSTSSGVSSDTQAHTGTEA